MRLCQAVAAVAVLCLALLPAATQGRRSRKSAKDKLAQRHRSSSGSGIVPAAGADTRLHHLFSTCAAPSPSCPPRLRERSLPI